ncbi:MAG: nodulation protein NfeD [Deltaproteobacteria bacterium]|nr:nodulation protein NfeD [Deltaproteobacteria bacterium]MBW2151544.1 nodulation protein NfeD [Deltaproteobacteria bacterium]
MKNITCTPVIILLVVFCALNSPRDTGAQSREAYIIKISGAIGPGVADFIKTGIKKASEEDAACIIIELDTPGGLAESMRQIVMDIYASKVPVVVYVFPSGARAASAGVMITLAADIAAMAPGTNIGAASPVGLGGRQIDKTMSKKIINDLVAFTKGIAKRRGRNIIWAERAVRESVSVTESEALKENIIDIVATDINDLIRQMNGWKVEGKGTLNLEDVKLIPLKETLRTKVLKTISNPNIAYILLLIGLAGLYFEFSHPGAIFPGVIGGISLILAFFALQTLPINYAGILLILLSIVLFIMEMKITSYGLLSVAGIISLFLGSIMLFDTDIPGMRVSWHVLIPSLVLVSGFFVMVASLVFKSQLSTPRTGAAGIVGEIGVVKDALMPEGKVLVHGELWRATSKRPISEGARVRVTKLENLVLEVEQVDPPKS